MLTMLLMSVIKSEKFPYWILFPFSSQAFLDAIQFVKRQSNDKEFFRALKIFSHLGFRICFIFVKSVDVIKCCGRMSQLLHKWYWSLLVHLGFSDRLACSIACQEVGTHSIETLQLKIFRNFSRGHCLDIAVYFSIFENICEKSSVRFFS